MSASAVFIASTEPDFEKLLGLTHKMLGYSISAAIDSSRKKHHDIERLLACLAAFKNQDAKAEPTPDLLRFASVSILIAADERDILAILAAAGMPFLCKETVIRGLSGVIITGTLDQWRDAVISGLSPTAEQAVRECYGTIMGLFADVGLQLWKDFTTKTLKDQTFYLEDKRGKC